MPRTEQDRLDEELFWINMYLADVSRPKNSDRVIQLTKRKKKKLKNDLNLLHLRMIFNDI